MKHSARLSFTGDIMCSREQLATCRTSTGYLFHPVFEQMTELLQDTEPDRESGDPPLPGKRPAIRKLFIPSTLRMCFSPY